MDENFVYPIKVTKEEEGFFIEFIDFDELVTEAEKEEDIVKMAQEVLALELIDYIDTGKELPKPTPGLKGAIYIQVWLPYYRRLVKEVYVRKNVTIPVWLDLLAKEKNINFSSVLAKGIKEELQL